MADGACRRTERVARERHASHHIMAGPSNHVSLGEPKQAFRRFVPEHDDPLLIGEHRTVGRTLQYVRDLFHTFIQLNHS